MNKKPLFLLFTALICLNLFPEEIVTRQDGSRVILFDDHTWTEYTEPTASGQDLTNQNRRFLRPGIKATDLEIAIACEMYEQGWTYTMPRPSGRVYVSAIQRGRPKAVMAAPALSNRA